MSNFTPIMYVLMTVENEAGDKEQLLYGPFEGTTELQPFLELVPPDVETHIFSNLRGANSYGDYYGTKEDAYYDAAMAWKEEAEKRFVPGRIEEVQVP